jgi:Zn-dependent membrane protease YugP
LLLLGVAVLPFVLSTLALVAHQRANPRQRGPWLPEPAGPWLEHQIRQRRLPVRVEVHPRDGMDGYWPSVGVIGLSERTWGGCRPTDWAIAAHELGHARNMESHPLVAQLLPTARLAHGLAWRGTVAALFVAALLGQPWLLSLAVGFLALTVAAGGVVFADELWASAHGWDLLRDDRRMRSEARHVARSSMVGAASIYGLGFLGEVAVLAAWPSIATVATTTPTPLAAEVSTPGVWLLVVLVPVLALRAAHVLHQVLAPEPVQTDFRLFTVMHREARWEFLTGVGVLVIVALLHDHATGMGFAMSVVLATTTAIGPVAGLARALVLLPVLLVLYRFERRAVEDDDRFFPEVRPDEAAPALMALYSDPPWYLRVSWLAHLAYVPLLAVLGLQLLD